MSAPPSASPGAIGAGKAGSPMSAPTGAYGLRPAHPSAVIVACDAGYLRFASVLARQLAAVPGRRYDVLIGSPEALELPEALSRAGVGAVHATDPQIASALPLDARRSLATYMEVFLAERLRGVYDRILVLDADMLLERGDPSGILAADLHGHAVAAVRDNRQWRTPGRRVGEFKALGWPAAAYFNAGAVMIDTAAWARDDLTARCRAFARGRLAGLGRDQALVNGVLHGDWAELSPLWNWQFTRASAHLTAMADPCLVHFIGPLKPWKAESAAVVPLRYREAYAEPGSPPPARRWPEAGEMRRALFRQWRAAGPMLAYLNRFPDADSVLPGAVAPGTLPPG